MNAINNFLKQIKEEAKNSIYENAVEDNQKINLNLMTLEKFF